MTKSRMMTVGATLLVLAVAMRIPQAKEVITGETKFLGIF